MSPASKKDVPEPESLLAGFARQVQLSPRAVAVTESSRELTYAELDARADRVAHLLRTGAGAPGGVAAVCLNRSVDVVATLLGVWRAGMAYMPLGPDHPRDRLEWQMADSGARVVLTERALAGAVSGFGAQVVCVDTDAPVTTEYGGGAYSDASLAGAHLADPVPMGADDAAYLMHTSGSTGRPKRVMVTHGGLANRVDWTVRTHGLGPTDRVLQKTALTFDAAGWEIFAPLVSGGTLVMAPVGAELDPEALLKTVADQRITVLQVVPSVLRLLVDSAGWQGCDALRLLFCAGEPLHADLCQRLLERVDVQIWNTYGPTECSIDVTAHRFDPAQAEGPVAIGRPIQGTRVMVLDASGAGELVPVGFPGELYVSGAGLAHGYHGRPGATARNFVPDPYGPPGRRLYRTGDLVRWSADGELEFLGRADDQLKVNGVRVEPAEVEASLVRCPGVGSAVVRGVADRTGATRLAAYLLRTDVQDPEPLRAALRDVLPETMLPSAFVLVDEFPLTPNGKVDRAALPDPGTGSEASGPEGTGAVPLRSDEERLVAGVWSALLGLGEAEIGATDNFFQAGGSSLLVTRLASMLSTAAEKEIGVSDLFGAMTVQSQAALIAEGRVNSPIPQLSRGRPLPLSFGQRRQWFLDRLQPQSPEWVAPMFIDLSPDLPWSVVARVLDGLEERHESLRTRYVVDSDGEPAQVIDPPQGVVLRLAGVEQSLEAHLREEFAKGFDLEQGPLLRALLVRAPGEQTLVLSMHHIACDGWSTDVLVREFRELCEAETEGRAPRLGALPVQYADFASWQRDALTAERMERDLDFWRTRLDGIAPLELPVDRPRPHEWDPRGALHAFPIPEELATRAVDLGRRHAATPFMTFLTVFGVLLSRYGASPDVPVGVPVSGRAHTQAEGMVGFFLNSLVLRCDFSGGIRFDEAVERVRDTSLSSFAHQSLPFEILVDEIGGDRDLGRTPLYQVEFDMHGESWATSGSGGRTEEAFQRAWGVAKTDLCMYVRVEADGSMTGLVEYSRALFDAETIERFGDHYLHLLEAVTADPSAPVDSVPFLPEAELDRLLTGWRAESGGSVRHCVLDRNGNPAPTGVPGPIYIGGPKAEQEFAGEAVLTTFGRRIPDPFSDGQGWLYRSDTLGRRLADGRLERLGSRENGVRVRDIHVDVTEVEAAVAEHPAVAEARVAVHEPDFGDTQLRVYWTLAQGWDEDLSEDLAAHYRTRLPRHPEPAEFVPLETIPLDTEGRVDEMALEPVERAGDPEAPRTMAEHRIAEIWAEMLETQVDPEDSFFRLGGNSILAVRMVARLRDEFDVDVPIRRFFDHPTVVDLAATVEELVLEELAQLSDNDVLDRFAPRP